MPKGLKRALSALLITVFLYSLIGFLFLPGIALRIANQQLAQYATLPASLQRVQLNPFTLELSLWGLRIGESGQEQLSFQRLAPEYLTLYPLAALPIAFLVTACIGMALERTVIRHLYGRPLETLLATWGISLILIQLVRVTFGAQNVEVANPAWLSGGMQVLPNLVLPYNRIVIIGFALFVVVLTWLLLNKTRLGLNVRAVTQNRNMAACCGVPTGRVDMLAFGLGSGIAGLGGVALSQIGNVGPDLGQSYIIDSFLVVVLGGVGQLAGSVLAAFGLGVVNKFLEPQIGAVLGKILILALIILFIQKRPQGLFALKGRVID